MAGTVEGAKARCYSRSKVAAMMQKAKTTTERQIADRLAEQQRRLTDPFERAKLALQRAGHAVFSHSLHVPGSTLIVVGGRPMEPEQMVAHAQRFGRW